MAVLLNKPLFIIEGPREAVVELSRVVKETLQEITSSGSAVVNDATFRIRILSSVKPISKKKV